MAKFTIGKGAQEYVDQLVKLEAETLKIMGKAIYPGAGVIADQIRKNIAAVPVHSDSKLGTNEDPVTGLTSAQRAGLLDGLGISKARNENGYLHVKVGMDGYNRTRTKKHPNGQPNALIIRSLESGTSWRAKQPVISPAVASKRAEAEQKMSDVLDEEIKKVMKG